MKSHTFLGTLALLIAVLVSVPTAAQQQPRPPAAVQRPAAQDDAIRPAPNRGAESKGPFKTLVIRGAMLIDGTGAPARGPVDIVVEGNRITAVRSAGTPGVPLRPNRAPQNAEQEIDATGMYVMPGFVDLHVHAGGAPKNADAEYAYKLWLAHGVTTVRGVPLAGHSFTVSENFSQHGINDGEPYPLIVRTQSIANMYNVLILNVVPLPIAVNLIMAYEFSTIRRPNRSYCPMRFVPKFERNSSARVLEFE